MDILYRMIVIQTLWKFFAAQVPVQKFFASPVRSL
jgi:hypothetical protein